MKSPLGVHKLLRGGLLFFSYGYTPWLPDSFSLPLSSMPFSSMSLSHSLFKTQSLFKTCFSPVFNEHVSSKLSARDQRACGIPRDSCRRYFGGITKETLHMTPFSLWSKDNEKRIECPLQQLPSSSESRRDWGCTLVTPAGSTHRCSDKLKKLHPLSSQHRCCWRRPCLWLFNFLRAGFQSRRLPSDTIWLLQWFPMSC